MPVHPFTWQEASLVHFVSHGSKAEPVFVTHWMPSQTLRVPQVELH
jgi:hypothetical protein